MNNLQTGYRVNEQGMIVEEVEKLSVDESEEKESPQHSARNAISKAVATENVSCISPSR